MVGTTPPHCLTASETEARFAPATMNLQRGENSEPLLITRAGSQDQISGEFWRWGEVFCLDFPFYRTGFPNRLSPGAEHVRLQANRKGRSQYLLRRLPVNRDLGKISELFGLMVGAACVMPFCVIVGDPCVWA